MYSTCSTWRRCHHRPGCPAPPGMNIRAYNIWYSHGFGIPQAIHMTQMSNYCLMIPTETNITDAVNCKNRLGYDIACLRAVSTVAGGAQKVWYWS